MKTFIVKEGVYNGISNMDSVIKNLKAKSAGEHSEY
jgi:hypothetical protein